MSESLAMQFMDRFKRYDRSVLVPQFKEALVAEAIDVLQFCAQNRQFNDVTGNLVNSVAAGCYYKGKLYRIVTMQEAAEAPRPTRRTLKKGEKYNLEFYASGQPASKLIGQTKSGKPRYSRPFVGKFGEGGQDGETSAEWKLRRMHPNSKATYAIGIVAGVSYAGFVETKYKHDVLTGSHKYMQETAEANIVMYNMWG